MPVRLIPTPRCVRSCRHAPRAARLHASSPKLHTRPGDERRRRADDRRHLRAQVH